jgi:hypothetical protein
MKGVRWRVHVARGVCGLLEGQQSPELQMEPSVYELLLMLVTQNMRQCPDAVSTSSAQTLLKLRPWTTARGQSRRTNEK